LVGPEANESNKCRTIRWVDICTWGRFTYNGSNPKVSLTMVQPYSSIMM